MRCAKSPALITHLSLLANSRVRPLARLLNVPARVSIPLWAAIYVILFFAAAGLRFPARLDEQRFWPISVEFSHSAVPTLQSLRSYDALNTPLPFVIFGTLEREFHGGIFVGRLFNLALSFCIISLIVLEGQKRARANLAAVGLALFPYFLGLSVQLYTDIIATFAVVAGVWFYVRGKHIPAAIGFACAIATRQYTVAFPIAIVVWELFRSARRSSHSPARWIAPSLAAATLGGWYWLFDGPAPRVVLEGMGIPPNRATDLAPSHLIFLLTCAGLYYVCVELALFRRWSGTSVSLRRAVFATFGLVAASLIFHPLGSTRYGVQFKYLGVMDHTLAGMLPGYARVVLYGMLASLAVLRFVPLSLPGLFVWSNAIVLMAGQIAWEKYAMPLIAVLWYLRAQQEDPAPVPVQQQPGVCSASTPCRISRATEPQRKS